MAACRPPWRRCWPSRTRCVSDSSRHRDAGGPNVPTLPRLVVCRPTPSPPCPASRWCFTAAGGRTAANALTPPPVRTALCEPTQRVGASSIRGAGTAVDYGRSSTIPPARVPTVPISVVQSVRGADDLGPMTGGRLSQRVGRYGPVVRPGLGQVPARGPEEFLLTGGCGENQRP